MKKHLLIALLAAALATTMVACGGDDPSKETEGDTTPDSVIDTLGDTDGESDPAPVESGTETPETAPPDTKAPETTPPETTPPETTPPETKPPETKPQETTPAVPEDPNAPVAIFDADALNSTDAASGIESMTRTDDYLSILPSTADPHYTPIRSEDGARFVVIKYRAFNAEGMSIQIYPGSVGEAPSDDSNSLRTPAIDDGAWHLAIFDTATIDPALYDGSYMSYLRFDPLDCDYILNDAGEPYKEGSTWVRYPKPDGATIDVQYIAFFHTEEAALLYDAKPSFVSSAEDIADCVAVGGSGVEATYNEEDDFTTVTVTALDPQFMVINPGSISELSGKFVALRYRTEASDAGAEFFIGSGGGPAPGTTEVNFRYQNDGDWHLLVVDASEVPDLTGYIHFLRYDIFHKGAGEGENLSLDLRYIAVFDTAEQAIAYDKALYPIPENSESFKSDLAGQTEGTGLDASDLLDGFLPELPVGENLVKTVNGTLLYQLNGISDLLGTTDGAYFFKVNMLTANANSAMVVRGNGVMNSDEVIEKFNPDGGIYKINNFYETDGAGAFGGSGVFVRLDGGMLHILIKTYDPAAVSRVKNVSFSTEAPGTELCIVDDGSVLHLLVDGKKYAEIDLAGKQTYADIQEINCSVSNVFAKTATVNLADGAEHVVENTLVSSTFVGNIALAVRAGEIQFTAVEYGPASAVSIPAMEATVNRVNVAEGKPATADSVENETNIPANATDGDLATRWGAFPTGVANLTIDLLYPYTIDQIYVHYENSVLPHTVAVSVDGVDYKTVYESPSRSGGELIIRFEATEVRYIRFTREGEAPEGQNWFSIYEVKALAPVPADEEPVLWDVNKDIVLHQSFDELRQNGTGASVFTPGQSASWDNKAVLSADITSLYYHGWVALKGAPGQLGYQIDDLAPVYSDAFMTAAEQGVLDAAATLSPDAVFRTAVSIDLSGLYEAHTVKVFYKNTLGQTVILCEFAVELPARVKPAHGYVTDGLVSLYNQHNLGADATTWWDNAGDNDMTIQLSESSYLAADGLHTAGTKHYFPEAIVDVVNGNAFTVELLFGDFVSIGENYNTFLNSQNDNFALFRRLSDDVLEFKFAANSGTERHKIPGAEALLPNSLITVTYTVGGECVIYVNGVAAATKASPSAMGADNLFIGQTGTKDFRAVYQSIRFYDRALSADEVLANAKADAKA